MALRSPQTLAVAFPSHRPSQLTGELELSLAETVWSGLARPVRVSRVLELMFDQISSQPVTGDRVRRLASSAREWLLQRAALRVWPDRGWFQAQCRTCGKDFDLPVKLASAPRKPAEAGFPVIEVETSLGRRAFEAPNGDHEETLSTNRAEPEPVRQLVALCGLDDSAKEDAAAFSGEDLERIETAFEAACPDIADAVLSRCPACETEIEAQIDPLKFAFPRAEKLLREVHAIAVVYHWSEADILALPAARRVAYAGLIATASGVGRRK